jgi:hypothetical protein
MLGCIQRNAPSGRCHVLGAALEYRVVLIHAINRTDFGLDQ